VKRFLLIVSVLILATAPFSVFAGGQAGKEGKVLLNFWQHEDPRLTMFTKQKLESFMQKNPNIEVKLDTTPHVDYEPKLIAALAAGSGPDVYDIGDWNIPAFLDKKIMAPADPKGFGKKTTQEVLDLFYPGSLEGFYVNGKLYGAPLEYSGFLMYLNPVHFKEAGLNPDTDYPKSWKDVGEVGAKLKIIKDGKWVREGAEIPYFDPTWTMIMVGAIMNQAGATLVSKDGKSSTLTEPAAVKAFKAYTEIITKYKAGSPDVSQNSPTQPASDFGNEKLSIWWLGPWGPAHLHDFPVGQSGNWAIKPLPQLEDKVQKAMTVYGWAWCMNPASKRAVEDWMLIDYLSADPEFWLKNIGLLQARKGAYENPTAKTQPYIDLWKAEMATGKYMPRTVVWQQAADAVHRSIQRITGEGQSVEEALQIAKDDIDKALKEKK
jgi:multiple sugar transport system substrate-binding protein